MQPGLSDKNHKHWNSRADRAALIDPLPSTLDEWTAHSQIQPTLWFLEDKKNSNNNKDINNGYSK